MVPRPSIGNLIATLMLRSPSIRSDKFDCWFSTRLTSLIILRIGHHCIGINRYLLYIGQIKIATLDCILQSLPWRIFNGSVLLNLSLSISICSRLFRDPHLFFSKIDCFKVVRSQLRRNGLLSIPIIIQRLDIRPKTVQRKHIKCLPVKRGLKLRFALSLYVGCSHVYIVGGGSSID